MLLFSLLYERARSFSFLGGFIQIEHGREKPRSTLKCSNLRAMTICDSCRSVEEGMVSVRGMSLVWRLQGHVPITVRINSGTARTFFKRKHAFPQLSHAVHALGTPERGRGLKSPFPFLEIERVLFFFSNFFGCCFVCRAVVRLRTS